MSSLAIIIPAYKATYLRGTLQAIALQTNKEFAVYIGDDNSPYDLMSIVNEFKGLLDISYTKFENNLGSQDLVAQWTRCVDLSQAEEWIWLFSDDDIMETTCVESFYKEMKTRASDVYRFSITKIDSMGKLLDNSSRITFPSIMSSRDFIVANMKGQVESFAVEYIFSKRVYALSGGFVSFDLAWSSDFASWAAFSQSTGIASISSGKVYWRSSGENITPNRSKSIMRRKVNAIIQYIIWANSKYDGIEIVSDIRLKNQLMEASWSLPYTEIIGSIIKFYKEKNRYYALIKVCVILSMYKCFITIRKRRGTHAA